MAKKKKVTNDVLVVGVLDRSGSMASCLNGAIEGWNDYLKDLQQDENGETLIWLTGFDTVFDHWERGTLAKDVPYLEVAGKHHDYPAFVPRGGTALYDAIANSIVDAEVYLKKIGRDASSDNPMKVLHVTLTDGGENSSQEYRGVDGASRLQKLTKEYEGKGNWTFVFLGANQDTGYTSASMGYSGTSHAHFSQSVGSYNSVSRSLSGVTSTLKSSPQMSTQTPFADAGISQELGDEDDPTSQPKANETPISKKNLDELFGGK